MACNPCALFEILDLLFSLVLADTIGFLDFSGQLIALPSNTIDVVVGELTPLHFELALELLPVSFNNVPIHFKLLNSNVANNCIDRLFY